MNVIILDLDGGKSINNEDALRKQLSLDDDTCIVSLADLEETRFVLPKEWQGQLFKCILLTNYAGGFMQYHELLVRNNPARLWCFCALDVAGDLLKEQLIAQTMNRPHLRDNGQFRLVFDESKTLENTNAIIKLPIYDKFTCLVVSADQQQASMLANVLAEYSSAQFIPCGDVADELVEVADALLITGKRDEDFMIAFNGNEQLHLAVWIGDGLNILNAAEREDCLEHLADLLSSQGWNHSVIRRKILWGDVYTEILYRRWCSGDITLATLLGDENFVLMDSYGLPCTSQQYTKENIEAYFKDNCHLDQLIEYLHIH